MIAPLLAAAFLSLSGSGSVLDERDHLVLRGGRELRGRVLVATDDQVLFLEKGKERWIPRDEVRGMKTVLQALERYFFDAEFLPEDPNDFRARCAMARKLKDLGLEHEAKIEAWLVLRSEPGHEEAHRLLGHKKKGDGWLLPLGQDWVSWDEAHRAHSEWPRAWEVRTEHFAFRTDRGIFEAVALA